MPPALALLSSERPRNINWFQSAGLLFGDWGTSRLYVLGLAFLVAGRTSFYLICAMSLLILAVGWAYSEICRIYPDGGGVYTAARQKSPLLGVIGALLLFADYTVTASLSALEAFHYFGLGRHRVVQQDVRDAGSQIVIIKGTQGAVEPLKRIPAGLSFPADIPVHYNPEKRELAFQGEMTPLQRHRLSALSPDPDYQQAVDAIFHATRSLPFFAWNSPGLWAVVAIIFIGLLNQLGPKHSSGFAVVAAAGMIGITMLVVVFALPAVKWSSLDLGTPLQAPGQMWQAFVGIVLALSGVEAIANLTGIMKKPVYGTSRKAIATVAIEVALFNIVLALVMCSVFPLSREGHKEDMMAFLAGHYVGHWGELAVRLIGGVLLLSATNTAINGLMSIVYVMSRDGELPAAVQRLNGFGAPWIGGVLATSIPAMVLLFAHELETLSHLYAIGIVGAVAINCSLCAFHPRLRKWYRKWGMSILAVLLLAIWITLAFTKLHALIFVIVVLSVGLTVRHFTRIAAARRPKPSLLQQAIFEQLSPAALAKKRYLLATAGSDRLAIAALEKCRERDAALVVCFVREVNLTFATGKRMTLETDPAAQGLYADFLARGHQYGVPIIPMYDVGPNGPELIAEAAAMNSVEAVLIGSSRRGALHQFIKGSFQKKLESLLPPDIPVRVIEPREPGHPAQV